jgi:tetratricopeptide (TPR) repeat protein
VGRGYSQLLQPLLGCPLEAQESSWILRKDVIETGMSDLSISQCRSDIEQEIETWVLALEHYDNQEYEEAIRIFGHIADTSKIFFNCGVIYATLGEHEKAVSLFSQKHLTAVH